MIQRYFAFFLSLLVAAQMPIYGAGLRDERRDTVMGRSPCTTILHPSVIPVFSSAMAQIFVDHRVGDSLFKGLATVYVATKTRSFDQEKIRSSQTILKKNTMTLATMYFEHRLRKAML